MINTLLILLLYQLIGEVITRTTAIPIPGPVVGMLLLFVTLMVKEPLAATIEPTTQFILQNLTLLYVPAAVGIIVHLPLIQREGAPIILTLLVSSLITLSVTAGLMNFLLGKFQKPAHGEVK